MKEKDEENTFEDRLRRIDVSENHWKKKMMMVVNLYKSLGFSLKDVEKHSALQQVYLYVSELTDKIMYPDDIAFNKFMVVKQEACNRSKIRKKLTPENIRELVFNPNHKIKTSSEKEGEEYIGDLYANIGTIVATNLIRSSDFLAEMMKYLEKNKGKQFVDSFKEELRTNSNAVWEEMFSYYSQSPKYKKQIEDMFIKELDEHAKNLEEALREGLINRLLVINNFFKDTGYLEEMVETNNYMMNLIGVPPLLVSLEEEKGKFNATNLVNEAYYRNLSTEELLGFSAHYTNRFEKKLEDISDGVYLHEKLDTFYDMVDYGDVSCKISSDDARVVLKQKRFLEQLFGEMFIEFKNNDDAAFNFTTAPKEYIKKYGNEYRQYFDRYIYKGDNNLEKDYQYIILNKGTLYCMYALKDFSIESLLYVLANDKSNYNFGIIEEEKKTINEYGEEQILVGADYRGYPPIRLHYPEETFYSLANRVFSNKGVSDYIGNEDFKIIIPGEGSQTDRIVKYNTHILYKYTKDQIKALEQLMKNLTPNDIQYYFVRHILENVSLASRNVRLKKENNPSVPKSGTGEIE